MQSKEYTILFYGSKCWFGWWLLYDWSVTRPPKGHRLLGISTAVVLLLVNPELQTQDSHEVTPETTENFIAQNRITKFG